MRWARLLPASVALVLLCVQTAAADAPQFQVRGLDVGGYPTIRFVVRSGSPSGAPSIFENGVRVSGASETNLAARKAIVVAIDRSQSMAGDPLGQAATAAKQLIERKRRSDRIEVVTFGSTALAATPFSQSPIDSDSALSSLAPDPTVGTALYDATVLAADALRAQPLRGRVLVLLTDGRDLGSKSTLKATLRAADKAGIVIYSIALGHAAYAPLQELARGTGGLFYTSPTPAALASIYRQIASELNHTWRVSYTTTALPGDRITVSVGSTTGPNLTGLVPGNPPVYRPLLPRTVVGNPFSVVGLVLIIAAIVFFAVRQLRMVPQRERMRQRVLDHTSAERAKRPARSKRAPLTETVRALNRRLRRVPHLERIDRVVEAAGIPASSTTIVIGSVVLAFVLSLLGAGTTGSGTVIFLFFIIGLAGPFVVIHRLGARRVATLEKQLPDVLATIASSLRVGHGLKQALQTVASEGAPPVTNEVRRVLAEARLGRPLEEALVAMCERLGSEDLLYIATAVDVQSQVGGSLAGVFETVSTTVRERQQHRRRIRAVTSTGRMTAIVMSLMPFAFLLLMLVAAPSYVTPFLGSHIGHVLLLGSLVSIGIGGLFLNRIVSVKA